MSVNATENDPPRFFVGEDGEGLLDSARSTDYEHFYDHGEEEEEEYDSVCIVGTLVYYSLFSSIIFDFQIFLNWFLKIFFQIFSVFNCFSKMALTHISLVLKWCSKLRNCSCSDMISQ